jgi:hypothetical protein
MNRDELAHVLRAASQIADDPDVIVLGSQAILGTYDSRVLPAEAIRSMEADVAFRADPDNSKSDSVDGAIGEMSGFHQMYGYYAQDVSVETAVLPTGWEERVVPYIRSAAEPSRAVCIDAHDLVVSKLVAGREKDVEFATALLSLELISVDTLVARADLLPTPGAIVSRVRASIERCARAAQR